MKKTFKDFHKILNYLDFTICSLGNPIFFLIYIFFIYKIQVLEGIAMIDKDMKNNINPIVYIPYSLICYSILCLLEFLILKKIKNFNWQFFLWKKFSLIYILTHSLGLILLGVTFVDFDKSAGFLIVYIFIAYGFLWVAQELIQLIKLLLIKKDKINLVTDKIHLFNIWVLEYRPGNHMMNKLVEQNDREIIKKQKQN